MASSVVSNDGTCTVLITSSSARHYNLGLPRPILKINQQQKASTAPNSWYTNCLTICTSADWLCGCKVKNSVIAILVWLRSTH